MSIRFILCLILFQLKNTPFVIGAGSLQKNDADRPLIAGAYFFMETEIWKDVNWSIGIHQVSSHGRFKSLSRWVRCNKGMVYRNERILKQHTDKGGYLRIDLSKDRTFTQLSHRVTAIHFVDNPKNKPWVNHEDGIKINNYYKNLEWSTIRENVQHAYDNNLNWAYEGEESQWAKLTEQKVLEIRSMSVAGLKRNEIAKFYSVTPECISSIVLRKTWKHI